MLAGIGQEYLLKVRTAYGQDDFMRLQESSITCQGHIHQVPTQVQPVKPIGYILLEILPAQRELFHINSGH